MRGIFKTIRRITSTNGRSSLDVIVAARRAASDIRIEPRAHKWHLPGTTAHWNRIGRY